MVLAATAAPSQRPRVYSTKSVVWPGLGIVIRAAPWVVHYLCNREALVDVPIEHRLDQIDRRLTQNPRYSKLVIHNLVDAVERIFFVHEGIEQDAKSPNILFFSTVGFSLQYFWSSVV